MCIASLDAIRTVLPPGYTVDSYLDQGGQGAVFRGTVDGRAAAIKLFMPGNDERRLERELSLLTSIACQHLVQIIRNDWVVYRGTRLPLVAYELHSGGDLRKYLEPSAVQVEWRTLAKIGHHVGQAIESLWNKRIVHRDVKPGNIVCSDDGRFILVDVGLARHIDRSDITAAGAAPGTNGYKSPEQARGRRHLTINSDWFSLGVTLYHIAAKRHPFNGMQQLIGNMTPSPLEQARQDMPEQLCRTIHQMMAAAPAMRIRDVVTRFRQFDEE